MSRDPLGLAKGLLVLALLWLSRLLWPAQASSHMNEPPIPQDDPAGPMDLYAFLSEFQGQKMLAVALVVDRLEEPGIGSNAYDFDPDVLYEIHVATGQDVAEAKSSITWQFQFETRYKDEGTILQSYLGIVDHIDDANQNRTQTYSVLWINHHSGEKEELRGIHLIAGTDSPEREGRLRMPVPPNNQGRATPFYNELGGQGSAQEGVKRLDELDRYTQQSLFQLSDRSLVFAGQRDEGFYADTHGIFDLFNFGGPTSPFDSHGGFNVHMIVLQIPLAELGGDRQIAGVYATASRRKTRVLNRDGDPTFSGGWIQVARQGNPLFKEALIAIQQKAQYNRTPPSVDASVFKKYALIPELAHLLNIFLKPTPPALEHDRTDIGGIFIPDIIKVDLSTRPARLAGNPDDVGFSRLSFFGGDVLRSSIQDPLGNGGFIPGGWPNGRRFGDDVLDIAVCALLSDLRGPLRIACDGAADIDGVTHNDITYNKVFPYAATPLNGRNHGHHGN
jgi:hypothetical protein